MPPTPHHHNGFRNAIRIRRRPDRSTPSPDVGPFELQVVERAVRDEQDEHEREQEELNALDGRSSPEQTRGGGGENDVHRQQRPQQRPSYQRQSSLLENLVRQDRAGGAPSSSSSSSKGGADANANGSAQDQSTPSPPSFTRLNSARSRDTAFNASQPPSALSVLHVLHEGDETASGGGGSGSNTPSLSQTRHATPANSYRQGTSLAPALSAPARASPSPSPAQLRPPMVHSGPSSDRLRGQAPGPRFVPSYPAPSSDTATRHDEPSSASGTAAPQPSHSYPASSDMEKAPDTDTQQEASNTKQGGLLSALMRRGRSSTMPSIKRATSRQTLNNNDYNGKEQSPSIRRGNRTEDVDEAEPTSEDDEHSPDMHEDGVVDYLDVVDAEVGVLNHMSNIQNSIFLPHIPALYDRRPTHTLPSAPSSSAAAAARAADQRRRSAISQESGGAAPSAMEEGRAGSAASTAPIAGQQSAPGMLTRMTSAMSFTSTTNRKRASVTETEAAEHFSAWADMTAQERHELDEHVQHLLTRPEKFRRGLRGFRKFVSTPSGFIMLCYGVAITGWGIVIMLFIWKWINLHDPVRQRWWIEICDQVLCALFAAVGLGFAPFRAVDTWRMCHIAHYHHLSWKRRKQFNLPKLKDPNDLPRPKGYNEAFPKPAPLDLITEEELELSHADLHSPNNDNNERAASVEEVRTSHSSSGGEDTADAQRAMGYDTRGSGSSRLLSPLSGGGGGDVAGEEILGATASPTTRSRSSTTSSTRPAVIAQAISNANAQRSHRWWHVRSKREKEESKYAAGAALQAVESLSPSSSTPAFASPGAQSGEATATTNNNDEKSSSSSTTTTPQSSAPPSSGNTRPQLRAANVPPALHRTMSIVSELEKDREDVVVLTHEEQAKLNHHQRKFHQSHTFYRYHETATHSAFPLDLMIVIVCLLDCHSLLQGTLGGVTWGINYHHRPTALTATLITCSLSCNAVAGFLIYLGGRRTKKSQEVKRRLHIALEEEAYRDMLLNQKRRDEEQEMRKILAVPAPTPTRRGT